MNNDLKPNREVKSSAFTAFFSVPENAAKLYAALSEHQSIINANMPLRDAISQMHILKKQRKSC